MPDAYVLPLIPYLRLRVTMRAVEPAAGLPAYHGSMLRGAFGHALRRTVCSMGPAQACVACRLRRVCVYPRIFETFVEGEPPPFLRGIDQAVRPYVFEPRGGGGPLPRGGMLGFDLLLFGQAIDLQAYAILALERMAQAGLGAGRTRFELAGVEALEADGAWRELFGEEAGPVPAPAGPSRPSEAPLPAGAVTLRFATPLRIKVRHQLSGRPRFRDLAFHMLRRTLEMAHWHVPGAAVDWDFQALLQRCEEVRVARADLRWLDWERWSNRQSAAMKLGGLVGDLILEGDLSPFTSLLRTAEVLHAGKGATFGLGKVEVSA
jgi:hypothetical protein